MQNPSAHRVWDTALGQLQLKVTRPNYDTWLKDTVGLSTDNGSFIVGTPSDFVSEWLTVKMGPVIAKTVGHILGREVNLRFQVIRPDDNGGGRQAEPAALSGSVASPEVASSGASRNKLNVKFTFDRFIVGESNRLAVAAALAAADQPGDAYNPLFIYGGPGLGKTHLLHAIAHRAGQANRRVVYATSEQFTNDFVTSISQGHQDDFRRKYRSAHLLLVDDVQFLGSKERTQDEFFHTFNDLHTDGCQVVLTCDHSPKAIAGLQSRLSSRFQWGLIADIQPPDEETRLAILNRKALEQQITIPPEVAQYLSDRAQDNVRELEGSLNRVAAYANLLRSAITMELASLALTALTPPHSAAPLTSEAVVSSVARYFNISPATLASPSRARAIAEARHIAMYLLREEGQLSLKQIGRLLGNRDHSTVIHGCRKVSTLINTTKGRRQLAEIQATIRA